VASAGAFSAWRALPRPLQIFLGVSLGLLACALTAEIVSRYVLHLGFPYRSPLLFEHFPDVITLRDRFQYFHTLQFFTDEDDALCMYPAPVAVLYRLLFCFQPHDLGVYLSFGVLSFLAAAILFGRALIHRGSNVGATVLLLSIAFFTAYPLWFVLKQANMEIFVWVILAVGIWCFFSKRGYSAAACFGIAGAMKIFPFVYLGLFLARRQYRQCLFALAASVAVTISSLWLVYPHILISWHLTNEMVARFRQIVALHVFPQSSFDHSLFGLLKRMLRPLPPPAVLGHILTIYLGVAALTGLALYIFRIRKLPVANQLLCLSVASILLPPTSFDYTLLHLYAPWALLILCAFQAKNLHKRIPGLTAAFVCFAILLVPETELIWHTHSYAGQVKALVLCVLFAVGLRYPFQYAPRDAAHAEML